MEYSMSKNFFNARDTLKTSTGSYSIYRLDKLEKDGLTQLDRLPFSIRILLEALLRQCNEREVTRQDVLNVATWTPTGERVAMPYIPARVVMQDFSGVPAVVDLAAMRSAVARLGGDPAKINPLVPVDLIVDHSVQVDFYLGPDPLTRNADLEFQRNRERYEFLRWGQKAFNNFRVVPPATGIIHQINLEYLAPVVMTNADGEAFPDTCVGTDSHTTMINALGVVGWGVGGIEAEAAMLGQPIDMLIPDVIGMKFTGHMAEGVTATDVVLTAVQMLRKRGVVDKFVEFFGPGVGSLSLTDRAVLANMAPEYGATMGFFPVDDETIHYMKMTGRPTELVEAYCKEQRLFRLPTSPDPEYTDVLELDLSTVVPSLAGPKRPQDRVALSDMQPTFRKALTTPAKERGFELKEGDLAKSVTVGTNGSAAEMKHGAVVIAAITSCTNTSNPSVMLGAGLLAKKAVEKGMKVKTYVKTSLAPGSRVVTEYLEKAGLLEPLAQLGFNVVGYGCTTCIGNSGPLAGEIAKAITGSDLVAAAVISGNRNFEGRVHPLVKANYLASPPLVVSYALAGTVDIDLNNDPLGKDKNGQPVYLRDLWPSSDEIQKLVAENVLPEMFQQKYADVFTGSDAWRAIRISEGQLFEWDANSTYIQEPPFFQNLQAVQPISDIRGARVLALFGDSITTDHISPAGSIATDSPAGRYLVAQGIQPRDFNSYGARRGNDQVMTRGTFANIRIKNRLTPGIEGGVTIYQGESASQPAAIPIYDAAVKYQQAGVPTIILAGKEYGTGSSRDWAAKGPNLLGVKAVIAESYERIHRSNLVGMGVLPLQFKPGENADTLGLTGHEVFDITGLSDDMPPQGDVNVTAVKADGTVVKFIATVRLNTAVEVDYYRNGGVLNTVLKKMMA
jgi:aconitate hydratase